MTNAEQVQTLAVVLDALMASPPQLEVAEMLYRSIPGNETAPLPAPSQLEDAIHLRKAITDRAARMIESDERSDPGDNFASQHASGLAQQRDRIQADILEHGGTAEFPGLFHKNDGARVAAKIISNQWGRSWMVCDRDSGRATGVYYPAGKSGPRTKLGKAGLEERTERAPAKAIIDGHGKGLSGTAWVAVVRTDGGWPGAPAWRQKEER
jgi:hypothetical protein